MNTILHSHKVWTIHWFNAITSKLNKNKKNNTQVSIICRLSSGKIENWDPFMLGPHSPSSVSQGQCASSRNFCLQTWHCRWTRRRCQCWPWSHCLGTWSWGWGSGRWSPCSGGVYHFRREPKHKVSPFSQVKRKRCDWWGEERCERCLLWNTK